MLLSLSGPGTIRPTTMTTSTTTSDNTNSPNEEVGWYSPPQVPRLPVIARDPEGSCWLRQTVPWRALLLLVALAAIIGVPVSQAVTRGKSDASEPVSCNCIYAGKCFEIAIELREAVDSYLADNRSNSSVARMYGWPIGDWCVENIENLSNLFSVDVNLAAVDFNDDISRWDVSKATKMRRMFAGSFITSLNSSINTSTSSSRFNQSLADCNVSSVTDMKYMFYNTVAFNPEPALAGWTCRV
jgi:hypothetical protein